VTEGVTTSREQPRFRSLAISTRRLTRLDANGSRRKLCYSMAYKPRKRR